MEKDYSSRSEKIKRTAKAIANYGISIGTAAYLTGCATMKDLRVEPMVGGRSTEAGKLEQVAGIKLTTENSESAGGNGFWAILTAPFRPSQWSNHPYRTTFVTLGYIGVGVALSGGGGGGGSDNKDTTPKTEPKDKPKDEPKDDPKEDPKPAPNPGSGGSGGTGGESGGGDL